MSDSLSSSLHNHGHFSFLRHPTRILRRTQSNIIGQVSRSSSHQHLPSFHSETELKDTVSLTNVSLRHWDSGAEDRPRQFGHHHHQYHQHQHQCSHHRGVGLWRRWGSSRERTLHKEHSLASVEIGSWASRAAHRRGSTLPLPFCAALGPVEAAKKAEALEGVQAAIIKLFQRNALKENELGTLQESVRALSDADAGPLIYEYYKDQLLKKGMVILREKIKNDQGAELVEKLGETWDYFFTQILPTLQALMYPLAESSRDMDIRNTTLLEFRNIVVLKVGLKETVDSKKYEMPANIRQMLLVLQGLHDPTFLSKEQLDLEKLVACVVIPFLGSRGLYQGGPDPVTKANYRPVLPLGPRAKPKITITVSDAAADADEALTKSPRLIRLDHHPNVASPASLRKLGALHEPSSSQGVLNHRLKPVMEVLDVGRRHSIVGT